MNTLDEIVDEIHNEMAEESRKKQTDDELLDILVKCQVGEMSCRQALNKIELHIAKRAAAMPNVES